MMSQWIVAADRVVSRTIWALAAALLGAVACLGFYQVLTRFVLNQPSAWTEEVIGRLLIWAVALGTAAAFRQGALVSVDVVLRTARGRWLRVVRRTILVASLAFLAIVAWFGFDLAWRIRFQTFSTLPVSVAWAYLALPVGAVFSMLAALAHHFDPHDRQR